MTDNEELKKVGETDDGRGVYMEEENKSSYSGSGTPFRIPSWAYPILGFLGMGLYLGLLGVGGWGLTSNGAVAVKGILVLFGFAGAVLVAKAITEDLRAGIFGPMSMTGFFLYSIHTGEIEATLFEASVVTVLMLFPILLALGKSEYSISAFLSSARTRINN